MEEQKQALVKQKLSNIYNKAKNILIVGLFALAIYQSDLLEVSVLDKAICIEHQFNLDTKE